MTTKKQITKPRIGKPKSLRGAGIPIGKPRSLRSTGGIDPVTAGLVLAVATPVASMAGKHIANQIEKLYAPSKKFNQLSPEEKEQWYQIQEKTKIPFIAKRPIYQTIQKRAQQVAKIMRK